MSDDYRDSHKMKGEDYDQDLNRGDFNTHMTQCEERILKDIVRAYYPNGIPRYLDFACGTGRVTSQLESHASESVGIDVSKSMVEQARKKCKTTQFIVHDVTKAQLPIQAFDVVSTFRFFGNAQHELRTAALNALNALLLDDGILIFNNHRNPSSLHASLMRLKGGYTDDADLSIQKLRKLLDETGFEIMNEYGIGWWLVMHRLNRPHVFQSAAIKLIEPLSRKAFIARRCPAYICVARKKRS